eukprot:gene6793-8428_t
MLMLRVTQLLSESDAYLNRVFINSQQFYQLFENKNRGKENANYVLIKGLYVLSASASPAIPIGNIGLSKAQRMWLELGQKDEISVEYYDPQRLIASQVTFKIDYLTKGKRGPKQDSKQITSLISSNFDNQFLSIGQIIYIQHNSTNFEIKVDKIELSTDSEQNTSGLTQGLLLSTTQIFLQKGENSFIDIETSGPMVTNQIFARDWDFENMGIGGLDTEFRNIFRRAFSSRIYPPALVAKLGVNHVKGMLLYGPPGTGKTLIARQIGKMLNGREPKIVSGPSILNKYVGQSEENIRMLFRDAEIEQKQRGDDSQLHIIIFDEMDAICKSRGSRSGDTGVGDSVVNQLLAMIDGVEALNNILVIGMTNRKDMIDEALLRPGRLEVHVEISLPNEEGREQIFKIHTAKMSKNNILAPDVNLKQYAHETKNYSGAEIEGVVKAASSYAFSRQVDTKNLKNVVINPEDLKVTNEDFLRGLKEIKPAFGAYEDQFENYAPNGIINHGPLFEKLLKSGNNFITQVKNSNRTPLLSVLLSGKPGCGKTSFAATLGQNSGYPFVRVISPQDVIGYNEAAKAAKITKIFEDSYKSPISCIVVDDIERLIEYVPIGPRFSNVILQTLIVLLKKLPPKGRRLLVLATTSNPLVLKDMDLMDCFAAEISVPLISTKEEFTNVLRELSVFNPKEVEDAANFFHSPIPIKQLIMIVEMARQENGNLVDNFRNCFEEFQLRNF